MTTHHTYNKILLRLRITTVAAELGYEVFGSGARFASCVCGYKVIS